MRHVLLVAAALLASACAHQLVSEPASAMPYGAFGYDPFWRSGWGPYGRYDPWPPSRPNPLPTRDMVERALSEGVVEPGARATGSSSIARRKRRARCSSS